MLFFPLYLKRFLQLLDACLKSSMLPAYLAASFTKKLSRLSLSIPPAGSLVITALIYNLLRRNPTINHLVQVRPIFVSAKNILTDENDVCIIPLTTTQNNVYKSMDLQRGHSCSGNRWKCRWSQHRGWWTQWEPTKDHQKAKAWYWLFQQPGEWSQEIWSLK